MNPQSSGSLQAVVAEQSARPVGAALEPLIRRVHERFGSAVQAILFYGSCLRDGDPGEGLVDLYAVVDDYRRIYARYSWRLVNRWLPPNVFYLEAGDATAERTLRAKCAVVSTADFERGCTRAFESYLWGRFSQPCRLVFWRSEGVRERLEGALAGAVTRLWHEALPCLPVRFDAATGWQQALALSYGVELRPEGSGRAALLVRDGLEDYRQLARALTGVLPALDAEGADAFVNHARDSDRRRAERRWRWRRRQGRVLHVLRLMKSITTFEGGVDYAAWKLRRHTGHTITVTPRLRSYPLIFGWPVLWRLLRDRILR
ncbi:hypothetical protein C7446_0939 [Kushneria sinocarnis]|uniref:Phosphatidate cytidylyltransferase n=1 Tax=Kushneria sinocarnis TaxID=595502 RepID=A0A420X0E9_9GAMM|nr:hypothetical protein [Kushneria sinocarnis]RKR06939.1 hypothetical protein C7446_0939 [Kushneria sinocarnis]